jgi:cardiolipin synthase
MLQQLKTAPNLLTLLRLIFIPFIMIAVLQRHWKIALALLLLAGISDGLDGLLARWLKQRTVLGQYLDPIADKLLLSTLFIELSVLRMIPWYVTVLVFTRDLFIIIVGALLYASNGFTDFRPSIFGKMNTVAQVGTVLLVLLRRAGPYPALNVAVRAAFWLTLALTVLSGVHYAVRIGTRARSGDRRSATVR